MTGARREIKKGEKVVKVTSHSRRGKKVQQQTRLIRIADPYIRAHKKDGRNYYYYCRGIDPEIYLGTADSILRAVVQVAAVKELTNKLPKKEAPIIETNPEYIS